MRWDFINIFVFVSGISLILHNKYYVTTLSAANNRNGIQAGLHFVMGRTVTPQRCQVLISGTCRHFLFGKKALVDMITWIIQVSPKYHHKCPSKRRAEGDWMQPEEWQCEHRGGCGSDVTTSQGMQAATRSWK